MRLAKQKSASVYVSICELLRALAIPTSLKIAANIEGLDRIAWPFFEEVFALTMPLTIFKLADIEFAIRLQTGAVTSSFALDEVTFVIGTFIRLLSPGHSTPSM